MQILGEWKNSCNSKFVQLLLLNRVKGKMIKKRCCSRFLLHKFVQLKYFWTQFKNVNLQGPCSLMPCICHLIYLFIFSKMRRWNPNLNLTYFRSRFCTKACACYVKLRLMQFTFYIFKAFSIE